MVIVNIKMYERTYFKRDHVIMCENLYYMYIYIYKCMYVCICVCIHVHVCHAYIVCHEYVDTCKYLFPVHLDIILLVVSDGDDSTKCWNSLFENPGIIEEEF